MNDAADISNSIRQGPGGHVGGGLRVAVVIPCYNEALAIEQVVQGCVLACLLYFVLLRGLRAFVVHLLICSLLWRR